MRRAHSDRPGCPQVSHPTTVTRGFAERFSTFLIAPNNNDSIKRYPQSKGVSFPGSAIPRTASNERFAVRQGRHARRSLGVIPPLRKGGVRGGRVARL